MNPKSESLSRRERQIMDIVYRRENASAAEVHRELPDPPSYSATRALLAVLVNKGHLAHGSEGRRYIYRPREPRKKAGKSALVRVLDTFYGGSLSAAMAGLLEAVPERLPPEEVDRLSELLKDVKSTSRENR